MRGHMRHLIFGKIDDFVVFCKITLTQKRKR